MILVGNIGIVSNRETWTEQIELRNDETDELFDISDADAMHIRLAGVNARCCELSGTFDDGTIINPSTGVLQWTFSEDQMRDLEPGDYNIGITIEFPEETKQVLIGTVSVVDGIVE